jgi:hypothetical protein
MHSKARSASSAGCGATRAIGPEGPGIARVTIYAAAGILILISGCQRRVTAQISASGGTPTIFQRVAASNNVAWLEQIAGSLETALLLAPRAGRLAGHAKDLRTAAYARLS